MVFKVSGSEPNEMKIKHRKAIQNRGTPGSMKRTLIRLLIVAVPAGLLTLRADSQTYVTTHRRATAAPTAPLEEDVTAKDVHFYSEGIQCYGKIFTPKGFDAESKAPAVVLAPGWGETAPSIEKYAISFASRGLVAMVIDYRGWGKSGGFLETADAVKTDDRLRFSQMTARVRIRRKRLIPQQQILDIRNALYYLQGEPGVDRARVGVWGTGVAGGHVIVIAASRVRTPQKGLRSRRGLCFWPSRSGHAPVNGRSPSPANPLMRRRGLCSPNTILSGTSSKFLKQRRYYSCLWRKISE